MAVFQKRIKCRDAVTDCSLQLAAMESRCRTCARCIFTNIADGKRDASGDVYALMRQRRRTEGSCCCYWWQWHWMTSSVCRMAYSRHAATTMYGDCRWHYRCSLTSWPPAVSNLLVTGSIWSQST